MLLIILIGILSMSPILKLKFLERLLGPKASEVEKELFVDDKVDKILGACADHVVIYNFDKCTWNRDYYLWRRIMSAGVDCSAMKQAIERCYPQIELAAVVGIATRLVGGDRVVFKPSPATPHDAKCLAYATLVVRDRKTGKLRNPKHWMKLSNCPHPAFVAEAMPQLLSGIGRTTIPMTDVKLLVKEHKPTHIGMDNVSYTNYQKVLRKYNKQMKKRRQR